MPYTYYEKQLKTDELEKMEPVFSAVSNNTRSIYILLQCISFSPKATVQITPDGIRVSVEEARVVQALAFLDKALFTSYVFRPPRSHTSYERGTSQAFNDNDETMEDTYPIFVTSLSALLETLKIFGINDPTSSFSGQARSGGNAQHSNPPAPNAFSAPSLLLDRSCTLQYYQPGSPLSITLSETGVKTTCELTTYEPDEYEVDIPLRRDSIVMKIIMRSAWLHNAITELGSSEPNILRISASAKEEPFFALSGLGGAFSESVVQFSIQEEQHQAQNGHHLTQGDRTSRTSQPRSSKQKAKLAPTVTETFLVNPPSSYPGSRIKQNYRFALIRQASRAMAVASKVSIRGDKEGVLSLQFMIEFDSSSNAIGTNTGARDSGGGAGGNTISFVDFRFVPLLDDDEVENGEEEERDDDDQEYDYDDE